MNSHKSIQNSAKLIISLLIISGCSSGTIKQIKEGVDMEMENGRYNIILDRNSEYERTYVDVDSIAVSQYSILLYGLGSKSTKEKKWFWISGRYEMRKVFGNWYDGEFRKYRINEIDKKRSLYRTLLSSKEFWSKY
jgi:hypothetical protein